MPIHAGDAGYSEQWGVLTRLVRQYDPDVAPQPDTVVVHLRVGDVLDLDSYPIPWGDGDGGFIGNGWSVQDSSSTEGWSRG